MSDADLLTAAQVAERLQIKTETILVWYRKGRIPGHRLSHRTLRFRFADVFTALEADRSRAGRARRRRPAATAP